MLHAVPATTDFKNFALDSGPFSGVEDVHQ
jgi:hypothetical protein